MDQQIITSIKQIMNSPFENPDNFQSLTEVLKFCENNQYPAAHSLLEKLKLHRNNFPPHFYPLIEHLSLLVDELIHNKALRKIHDSETETIKLLKDYHENLNKPSDKFFFPEKIESDAEDLILLLKDIDLTEPLDKSKELLGGAKRSINAKPSSLAAILLQIAADMLFCDHKYSFDEELNALALIRFLTSMDFKTYTISKSTKNIFLYSSDNILARSEQKINEIMKTSELFPIVTSIIDAVRRFVSEST